MLRRAVLAATLASPALAQTAGPWRIVAPFAPGTSADAQARLLALHLAPILGQTVLVENRAGAGGSVGAEAVVRSTDGRTVLVGSNGPLINNPVLQPRMPYETPADFAPIGMVSRVPHTLTVRADSSVRDVAQFVALARVQNLSIGSSGQGSATHFLIEQFMAAAGIRLTVVPYRGSSLSVPDTLAGNVASVMAEISTVHALWREGRLRVLATAGPRRSALMPEVPTLIESGYPGLTGGSWAALVGPASMPPANQAALVAALAQVMELPEFLERQAQLGAEVAAPEERGPAALMAYWRDDLQRTRATALAAQIRAE